MQCVCVVTQAFTWVLEIQTETSMLSRQAGDGEKGTQAVRYHIYQHNNHSYISIMTTASHQGASKRHAHPGQPKGCQVSTPGPKGQGISLGQQYQEDMEEEEIRDKDLPGPTRVHLHRCQSGHSHPSLPNTPERKPG